MSVITWRPVCFLAMLCASQEELCAVQPHVGAGISPTSTSESAIQATDSCRMFCSGTYSTINTSPSAASNPLLGDSESSTGLEDATMAQAMLETAGAASERSLSTQQASDTTLAAESESLSEATLESLASHEQIPDTVADSAASEAEALLLEEESASSSLGVSGSSSSSSSSHPAGATVVADSAASEEAALLAESSKDSSAQHTSSSSTGGRSSSSSSKSHPDLEARWSKAPTKYTRDDLLFVMPSSVSR